MDLLQLREKEVFDTLKKIQKTNFVVIGGYAVNAYALPRFSVDCDIVVENHADAKSIEKKLERLGYLKETGAEESLSYHGSFIRYAKEIAQHFKVSMDVLIEKIVDRQTKAIFTAKWVFEHSHLRVLNGKTIPDKLKLRVIMPDALVVMKFISCRSTDIRDVFMILPFAKDRAWIRQEIAKHYDFEKRFEKIKEKVTSAQFKDNLQGVYGFIDLKTFEKHRKILLGME